MLGSTIDVDFQIESGHGLGTAVLHHDLHLLVGGIVVMASDGSVGTGWVVTRHGPTEIEHAVSIIGVHAGCACIAGV